ncbi:MAG TPA: helix-turn-helix transcriptional regulator [Candidatus Thiothrix moscowensis]|uniref:helix-turn-helix domain-containing protein n=1 Tax=unclassified Thiothrix TaxID=2636184 RepID=UPI001A19F6F9|nr:MULTISPECIES: helix-turn-helix transcriptional regulator [unclassified Thiothrix]MBJ6608801.1 helix-turn-helix transcriptional regulator [Candidatus Thiothrix moscowensis]HRJ51775.1 helix-turn-helix transcriptional regulator [Candidatus Thiothrix moscowensis]HRJ92090.1 helix-turn-helix transcriptional regulator [Candidatus Thiothrix moscowensis]
MSGEKLAHYLEDRLIELQLSKSEAARRSGISRQTWYRLESGEAFDTRLSTLVQLAEALETEPLVLLQVYLDE